MAKTKKRPAWIGAVQPTIVRINEADGPYHVEIRDADFMRPAAIVVIHGKSEIGYADEGGQADYVLRGVLRRMGLPEELT